MARQDHTDSSTFFFGDGKSSHHHCSPSCVIAASPEDDVRVCVAAKRESEMYLKLSVPVFSGTAFGKAEFYLSDYRTCRMVN